MGATYGYELNCRLATYSTKRAKRKGDISSPKPISNANRRKEHNLTREPDDPDVQQESSAALLEVQINRHETLRIDW